MINEKNKNYGLYSYGTVETEEQLYLQSILDEVTVDV